jgi:serine/threonine protein kinase/tetratricopeptide (TPR) repeat protein
MPPENPFDRALEEIADGRPIDWAALEQQARNPDELEIVKYLRLLEAVGDVHSTSGEPLADRDTGATSDPDEKAPVESARDESESWGKYRLVEKVGEGGFGSVHRAWDPELEREVAIKILHKDISDGQRKERILREGRALARIEHPNVVRVLGVESHGDRVGLCMEFIRGETLATVVGTQGVRNAREAVLVGEDVCRALAAVHRAGFVHRDVKSRNVMRDRAGRIVLMDFGTGRQTDRDTSLEHDLVGTPMYMAPEVLAGATASASSDVYSVGVLLYYLVTAEYPVEGRTLEELRDAHQQGRRTLLIERRPDLPMPFVQVVERALAAPPQRYGSAGALLEALGKLFGEIQTETQVEAERTAPTSIVVMPTRVLGTDNDQYLADAIPNAISNYLVKVPGMETKRPPTTGDVDRVGGDLHHIASVYGASAYVVSSIVCDGGHLTLSTQLVEVKSRSLRWSDEYEGTHRSYGEVMKKAAEGIRLAFFPHGESMRTMTTLGASSEAELLLQRGLYHLSLFKNRGRPGDFERAATAFHHAAKLDTARADALVGMALLHNARIVTGAPPDEVIGESEKWARQALAIDQRSSHAWAILGEIETIRHPGEFRTPLEYGLKAASFGPRDAFAHTRLAGNLMMHSYELSFVVAQEATRLDPLVLDAPIYAAISLMQLSRSNDALALIDEALAVEPDMLFGVLIKAMILADAGATDDASTIIAELEPMAAAGRLLPQWLKMFRDVATYRAAAKEHDVSVLDQLIPRLASLARGEDPFPRWQVSTQGVTRLLAELKPDLALDLFEIRANMGIVEPYDYLATHPELDSLRDHARFQRLLAGSRRHCEEIIRIIHEAQERGEVPEYLRDALAHLIRRFGLVAAS